MWILFYDLIFVFKGGGGCYGWMVDVLMDGCDIYVIFDVLVWFDIVCDSMFCSILVIYW